MRWCGPTRSPPSRPKGSWAAAISASAAAPTPRRRSAPDATIGSKEPFEISDLMQQMGDTIIKVNQTIDDMKGDVSSAVVAVADTMGNANALITDVSGDVKKMAASGATDRRRCLAHRRRDPQRQGRDRQADDRRRALHARNRDRAADRAGRHERAPGRGARKEDTRRIPGEGRTGAGDVRRSQADPGRRAHGDGGLWREHGGAEAQLPGARLLQRARLLRSGRYLAGGVPQGCADHGRRTSVGPRLAARRCAVRAGVWPARAASG